MGTQAQTQTQQAARYLQQNNELRQTLGIGPSAQLDPVPLGAGEHNDNYVFANPATGKRYVLRVNIVPQPFHQDQVAYEFSALKALEPSGCTPHPLYVDSSKSLLDHGAMVISFCKGQELDFDRLRQSDLSRCVRLMARVHSVPVAADCCLFWPTDPLQELFDECMTRFEVYRTSGFEDERITRWTQAFIDAARTQLDRGLGCGQRHIINTETLPSHFLLPQDTASRADGYFIDWERPLIGDIAQDIAYFTSPTTTFWDSSYLMGPSQGRELVEEYWHAIDGRFERDDFDCRYVAWRMMTALRSTTWCCKAYALQQAKTGAYLSPKAAAKLPVYLSDDFMERIAAECFGL